MHGDNPTFNVCFGFVFLITLTGKPFFFLTSRLERRVVTRSSVHAGYQLVAEDGGWTVAECRLWMGIRVWMNRWLIAYLKTVFASCSSFFFSQCMSFHHVFFDSVPRFISSPLFTSPSIPLFLCLLALVPSSPSFLHRSSLPPCWQRLSWPPLTRKQARLSWQPPVVHMKWCTFIFRCLPFKTIRNGLTGALVPERGIFRTLRSSEPPSVLSTAPSMKLQLIMNAGRFSPCIIYAHG